MTSATDIDLNYKYGKCLTVIESHFIIIEMGNITDFTQLSKLFIHCRQYIVGETMPKFFRITEKHKAFQIYHLYYILGKPFGLSCYSISLDKKQPKKINVYVTPFDLVLLVISLMYNCSMILYHLHQSINTTTTNDHNGSIFHFGLQFAVIMCHLALGLSILITFFSRNYGWKVSQVFQFCDNKVNVAKQILSVEFCLFIMVNYRRILVV